MSIFKSIFQTNRAPFVIAELSANHNQDKSRAMEIIALAGKAGADAIKFQHFTPETITVKSNHPDFKVSGGTLWDGRQLSDLYSEAAMPWEWTEDLVQQCNQSGLAWLSTPFDITAVDFLEQLDIPAYKIASCELIDLPLIRYVASKGKPIIMSTGMASIAEIDAAVSTARESGAEEIALLRCNSGYPALPEDMNLSSIQVMKDIWKIPVGLSDHTQSNTAAIVAVALGAAIVEKHVTLNRADGGPDAEFSIEPSELADFVRTIKESYLATGTVTFGPIGREVTSLKYRRSLRATQPILRGEKITAENVRSIRPAGGLEPIQLDSILGAKANRNLEVGAPITWPDLIF
jgi:pseudaminic acid synthase